VTHPLLELQAADTLTDQLHHRRSHLPEQAAVDAARAELEIAGGKRQTLQRRLDELEQVIARSEQRAHEIDLHRARLDKQMKTIIAPREAEALQHEIATLNERRSELDDAELEALEEQSQIVDEMVLAAESDPALQSAFDAASEIAAEATASIDAELESIAARLQNLRDGVDPALLRRYDEIRRNQVVAAAALTGRRCDGCYMDLSASEIDDVREAAAGSGLADCPHCGRILVL